MKNFEEKAMNETNEKEADELLVALPERFVEFVAIASVIFFFLEFFHILGNPVLFGHSSYYRHSVIALTLSAAAYYSCGFKTVKRYIQSKKISMIMLSILAWAICFLLCCVIVWCYKTVR